jgi:hypothetical protein
MVDEDHLEALDFMLWMSGSQRAATVAHTNQSTIIRRASRVLSTFGGKIDRRTNGWRVKGSSDLLGMERWIHQQFRIRGRKPLRLQVPFWCSLTLRHLNIPHWVINPACESTTCENPLELLRNRVIDGCILSPPQIQNINPELANELFVIPIYRTSIDLVLWPVLDSSSIPLKTNVFASSRYDTSRFQLHQFPFMSQCCRRVSQTCFASIGDQPLDKLAATTGAEVELYRAAFLTAEMRRPLQFPHVVDNTLPCPYVENLVILAEHTNEAPMQILASILSDHFCGLPN